jgi:AcrR family transcriptional regulator
LPRRDDWWQITGIKYRAPNPPTRQRRKYDSPLRRRQAASTRRRILAAGSKLLHEFPTWNWRELTVRAVARRARVNERTIYRYFPSERALRDAVLGRLESEAGVDLEGLRLEDVADVTRRILQFVSSFPLEPRTIRDPTVAAANQRQREALLGAVSFSTRRWPPKDRAIAAAMFDVLWSVVSYERLVADWRLAPKDAIRGITWVMGLVENAIRGGRRPLPPRRGH